MGWFDSCDKLSDRFFFIDIHSIVPVPQISFTLTSSERASSSVAALVNKTSLYFCLGIDGMNFIFKTSKPIYTKKQNLLYPAIL